MKTYQNLTKKTKAGLGVSVVLSAMTILANAGGIYKGISDGRIYTVTIGVNAIIMALLVMWYAFAGYKKPHGNVLRVVYFAFSVYLVIQSGQNFMRNESAWASYLLTFAALTVAYISGRLNKIEKNKKLLVFAGILLVVFTLIKIFDGNAYSFIRFFRLFSGVILFTALSFAYVARYEEHKAAGLEDAN